MKRFYLDRFGINYGDTSLGWKALSWWIPQQLRKLWRYKIMKNYEYPLHIKGKEYRRLRRS